MDESRRAEYDAYLRSEVWNAKRQAALEAAVHACQLCNRDDNLHVHHRTYERFGGGELLTDLTVLCKGCHKTFHGAHTVKAKSSKKRLSNTKRARKLRAKGKALPKRSKGKKRADSIYIVADFFLDSPPDAYTAQQIVEATGLPRAQVDAAIGSMNQRRELIRVDKQHWRPYRDVSAKGSELAGELERALANATAD